MFSVKDDIHLDENENYVGKQNFCSVSDLSCLEIYPFLDMELEQEIISGDIFSLPEENWNHLGDYSWKFFVAGGEGGDTNSDFSIPIS